MLLSTRSRKGGHSMAENTLTITDNRTGKTYTVPIDNGTIRALQKQHYLHRR